MAPTFLLPPAVPPCLGTSLPAAASCAAEVNNTASIRPVNSTKPSNSTGPTGGNRTATDVVTGNTVTTTGSNSSGDGSSVLASRTGSSDRVSLIEPVEGSTNVTLNRANAAAGRGALGASRAGLLAVALVAVLWAS